jgi:hypothetical protein
MLKLSVFSLIIYMHNMTAQTSGKLKKNYSMAIADYQKYLDLGGGIKDGDQKEVEEKIKKLKSKLTKK